MEKVVLTTELEAEFQSYGKPMELCNAHGVTVGLFFPLASYKKLLANLEIPYSKEELARRRAEKDVMALEDFWRTVSRQ